MSIEQEEAAAAAVAKTSLRISLDDIKAEVAAEHIFTLHEALTALGHPVGDDAKVLTICTLTTVSGFTVIGKSAPIDPANFNAELGAKIARDEALGQLWPLMGFARKQAIAGR